MRAKWGENETPTVRRMSQATYSANSSGDYALCSAQFVRGGGSRHGVDHFGAVARIRGMRNRVIILEDKPQKDAPADFWHDAKPALRTFCESRLADILRLSSGDWFHRERMPPADATLWADACAVGLAFQRSMSQFGLTDEGRELARAAGLYGEKATA